MNEIPEASTLIPLHAHPAFASDFEIVIEENSRMLADMN
ncbi:MAG: hypothetical protein RLZZ398_363 [Verrucomicrobiota bacterium]|jgi:hypothetical protein